LANLKKVLLQTELGKEFEYKIDSMFDPKSSEEVKEILNDPLPFADPNTAERFRASLLRTELDLPIKMKKMWKHLGYLMKYLTRMYTH
jgi:hypothetical protein